MDPVTIIIANALYRYFETLYNLNQNLMVLCGEGVVHYRGDPKKRLDDVLMSIPRLVPYVFNKTTHEYRIVQSDGLMKFSGDIPFISEDYENILKKHIECLEKVKKIRNKLEHEMHGPRIIASNSGTFSLFSVTYEVVDEEIELCANELIAFVKDMNILFSKLQDLVINSEDVRKYEDYPYYLRLTRYDFSDFNRLFESNLIKIFGKALVPF